MKNYLSFKMEGKQLFPYWLPTYILGIILSLVYYLRMKNLTPGSSDVGSALIGLGAILFLIVIIYVFYFYAVKFTTESIVYEGEALKTSYGVGEFLGMIVAGILLSIVTLGIYIPWFVRKIYVFFIGGASYKETNFKFNGDGLTLLGIMTLLIVVPVFIISFMIMGIYGEDNELISNVTDVYSLVTLPILYSLLVKWMIDGGWGDYKISFKGKMLPMVGFLFIQLLLAIITIGIYIPLFYLRVYKYAISHVGCINSEGVDVKLDYDLEPMNDFLFMWGQILLIVVTLGIYLPWGYTKIMKRVLEKTSLE